MKLTCTPARHRSAFTMIEIAIALAVIAFALVAIIGVLPLGMNVQKENRERTIINQDAAYLIEAIRNGARGADDLTNYVLSITNYVWQVSAGAQIMGFPPGNPDRINWYTFETASINGTTAPAFRLTNGARIVGLLSTPKQITTASDDEVNQVIANFRAISGAAAEKFPQKDDNQLSLAFSYRLVPQLSSIPAAVEDTRLNRTFDTNLHEVRLVFRWPLLPNGVVGGGPKCASWCALQLCYAVCRRSA